MDNQQVDADLTRLPTGTAGWCALVDHALALGDLSEVDYLELKGTLPFAASSDWKRSAVLLSRTVLGLANRMPDSAERHLGGHGVVLVGIDGGNATARRTGVLASGLSMGIVSTGCSPPPSSASSRTWLTRRRTPCSLN